MINILIKENIELNSKIYKFNEDFNTLFNKQEIELNKVVNYNKNWIRIFGIYNNENYIFIYLFGIKLTIIVNEKNINRIAWWIPVKKWRDNFRSKFARPDQTRPDQTRPDQTRPDQTRHN